MKQKLLHSSAISVLILAGFAVSASAEEIPLFDATAITDSGFSADITQRYIFAEAGTTVFCEGPGTGNLQTVGSNDGSLIVDNYVTLNEADGHSICTGGTDGLPVITGTNCFSDGQETGIGDPIETVFDGATATVDLLDGQNDLVFKLWDWGGVYGNTALELALPDNCSSEPITTANLCAAQDIDIGDVKVWNDSDYLYVKFVINEPNWYLEETHVAVGYSGDMTNKSGNPVPGQFPYECESLGEQETSCTVAIPFGEEEGEINFLPNDVVDVAAHAVAYQLKGDGCNDDFFYASEVIGNSQGFLVDGTTPVAAFDPSRADPESVFAAGDDAFFSLGFDGSLTVGFGDRIYNGPGADVCAREVTNGRDNYPEEKAGVLIDAITPTPAEITNAGTDDAGGKACVGLPFDVINAESVTLFDTTDPNLFDGTIGQLRTNADGYDVDWIAACYLANDETAWGGACLSEDEDAEGFRFTERGNWGTYFRYEIQ